MQMTQVFDGIEKPCVGYAVNSGFSKPNTEVIAKLMGSIKAQFGDAVYTPPADSLHVTLLDYLAPASDFDGQDKDSLFDQIYPAYDAAMEQRLSEVEPFEVTFTEIRVTPTTIIIVGQDNGSFERIRNSFVDSVDLLSGSKPAPNIIHSSIARFTKQFPLVEVEDFISNQMIEVRQSIDDFRLMRITKQPMLESELIKTYRLRDLDFQ